jgi:all-trans-8'-apo-beta-carotenal 15,15'-oxygenase
MKLPFLQSHTRPTQGNSLRNTPTTHLFKRILPHSAPSPRFSRYRSPTTQAVAAPDRQQQQQQQQQFTDTFTQSDWDNFLSGYQSQYKEHAYWISQDMVVEGTIPKEITGTLLRNGPGLFEVGSQKIPQPFDGDGLVSTFSFKDGKLFFASRFVRTEGFLKEQEANKMLYRGAFSVGNPAGGLFYNPFDFTVKGIANTGVLYWADKILALYERDLPYELSPPDLKTKGTTDPAGTLTSPSKDSPYFGAHYRVVPDRNKGSGNSKRLIAFNATEIGGSGSKINIWEFDESFNLLHKTTRDLPGAAWGFFHDLAATEHYYIFVENPIRLDLGKIVTKYMWGKACIAECLVFDPSKKTRIHMFPRPGTGMPSGPETSRVFETTPFFSFHHGNAFEVEYNSTDDDDSSSSSTSSTNGGGTTKNIKSIVLDTVANHKGIDFGVNFETGMRYYNDNEGRGTLTRLVIDMSTSKIMQHKLLERACEFPSVAPAVQGSAHSHMYMVGSRVGPVKWGPPQVSTKVTIPKTLGCSTNISSDGSLSPASLLVGGVNEKIYDAGPDCFAQEPIFVPRQGATEEDDGWVMVMVYNSTIRVSELVVLNAKDMSVEAKVRLPHALPYGLHGSWTDTYLGADLEGGGGEWKSVEYDIRNGAAKYE